MKVWELISKLSKMEAGKEVEFSMLLSDREFLAHINNGENIGRYLSNRVDDLIELDDSVMLFSEERSVQCPKE